MVGRHPVLMRLKKIVAHGYDVVNREFRTGVGIKHGGLIDRVLAAGAGSLDRHELDIDIGAVQSGALFRQIPDHGGLDPAAVDQAGDFHTGVLRQVGNKSCVENIPADPDRISGFFLKRDASCV